MNLDHRNVITLDVQHIAAWFLVLMIGAIVAIGFAALITNPEEFTRRQSESLLMFTIILLIAVYTLGYLR